MTNHIIFDSCFRLGGNGETLNLPISLRSFGHYVVNKGWKEPYKYKDFVEFFWGVRGEGLFLIDGHK